MKIPTGLALCLLLALMPAAHAVTGIEDEAYNQAELDRMLAPIALYPDRVLSHILIAATYPLEVVQAARWVRQNPGVEGEAAVAAVADKDWDPSVKALVAFPELVERMDDDLNWTQQVGDAFLGQEGQVLATVQDLRQRAYDAGNLRSDEHVQVVREERAIRVVPVRERVVYVPYYDPRVVYGSWWHPHPPVYWVHPRPYYGAFYWGRAYHVSPAFFYSRVHWSHRHVVVVHHTRQPQRWQHNPRHRRGVSPTRGVHVPRGAHHPRGTHTRTRGDHRRWANDRRESLQFTPGGGRISRQLGPLQEERQRQAQPRSVTPAQRPSSVSVPDQRRQSIQRPEQQWQRAHTRPQTQQQQRPQVQQRVQPQPQVQSRPQPQPQPQQRARTRTQSQSDGPGSSSQQPVRDR